ncbi:MAG: M15 family metallopeptidase [Gammaproteobacteria bacterium]|nr:M15 family metallopeptidase [Gammaproteobacteria bacterium]
MAKHNGFSNILLFIVIFFSYSLTHAESLIALKRLQKAYPAYIQRINSNEIIWKDGTHLTLHTSFSVFDWMKSLLHYYGHAENNTMSADVLDSSDELFLKKMYGHTANEVKQKLVTIYWMPKVFGNRYPLKVTTVNGVNIKLQHISAELEKLPFSYYKYLANPAGTFYWRRVAGENYLSSHSFGIAIDINAHYANYWL